MRATLKKTLFPGLAILCMSTPEFAAAQSVASLAGTYQVAFLPVRTGGATNGCTFSYETVVLDYTYHSGDPVVLVGGITFWTDPKRGGPLLIFKLGTQLLGVPKPQQKFVAPFFAYLETPSGSTVNTKYTTLSEELGFKTVAFPLDDNTSPILKDLIEGKSVSIGFNLSEGAMDVVAQLDLSVARTDIDEGGVIKQYHSPVAVYEFADCVQHVTQSALSHLNK